MPVVLPYGRVWWEYYDGCFKATHTKTRHQRQITARYVCTLKACNCAISVANRTNMNWHPSCHYDMVAYKVSLLAALKTKEETGEWG